MDQIDMTFETLTSIKPGSRRDSNVMFDPLANDMFLVELLTLTFENEACCEWVSNVKVAPLGVIVSVIVMNIMNSILKWNSRLTYI